MMSDKKIDLLKHIAEDQSHPLDKNGMMEVLERLSTENEIVWEYVDFCAKLMGEISSWRDILSCISNRQRCENLIDSLEEEKLNSFSRVVLGLKHYIELDDCKEIYNATCKLTIPTETSLEKATQLLDIIKNVDDDELAINALSLFRSSRQLQYLGEICCKYRLRAFDDQWITNLAKLDENFLDHLISWCTLMFKNSSTQAIKSSDL